MIHSMTAFARHEAQGTWGSIVWELRGINHRYLEISLRLPDVLNALEPVIREQIKSQLQRGKIEITLRYQAPQNDVEKINVNKTLVMQLLGACAEITAECKLSTMPLNALAILQWPGVVKIAEEKNDQLDGIIKETFIQALNKLIVARAAEGNALQVFIEQRLSAMQVELDKLKIQLPQILQQHREKLLRRLEETKVNLDPGRLEQEMVLFAQKIDVAEELDRLAVHVNEMHNALKQGNAIGRRVDFLLQESNREANTLASKSVATETTLAAVELKVLIEQIREQIQNIE